ncbi:MAG TPA: hypothetical protein PLJ98_05635 [Acholeplasmataceae bacterium]|nr:hypothetical protein [Acholeplasmataceae bacterium]
MNMNLHVGEVLSQDDVHHGFHGCGEPECIIFDTSEIIDMNNEETE